MIQSLILTVIALFSRIFEINFFIKLDEEGISNRSNRSEFDNLTTNEF